MRNFIDIIALNEAEKAESQSFEFPYSVESALHRYTEFASKRLDPETRAYLIDHAPKSKETLTLYRAFTLEKDDVRGLELNQHLVDPIIKRWTGLSYDDLALGAMCVLNRGKESSWSHDRDTAESFMGPRTPGGHFVSMLFQAQIAPRQVLIDFAQLPVEYAKTFEYWEQQEVIVRGKVNAKLIGMMKPTFEWGSTRAPLLFLDK